MKLEVGNWIIMKCNWIIRKYNWIIRKYIWIIRKCILIIRKCNCIIRKYNWIIRKYNWIIRKCNINLLFIILLYMQVTFVQLTKQLTRKPVCWEKCKYQLQKQCSNEFKYNLSAKFSLWLMFSKTKRKLFYV